MASSPLAASPTISTSSLMDRAERRPSLVTGWSSTIRIRMGTWPPPPREIKPSAVRIVPVMGDMAEERTYIEEGPEAPSNGHSPAELTDEAVLEALKNVLDPELGI